MIPASAPPWAVHEDFQEPLQGLWIRVVKGDLPPAPAADDADALSIALTEPCDCVSQRRVLIGVWQRRASRPSSGERRLVFLDPALYLAHREVACEHHLQSLLLRLR